MKPSTRLAIAAFLLLGIAGYMTLNLAMGNLEAISSGRVPPPAPVYASRLEPIKPSLPRDGIVSYFTNDKTLRSYCMSRYVLSPLRLTLVGDHEVAIMDLYPQGEDPKKIAAEVRQAGYVVEKDFGDGLVLLKKRTN